MAHSDNNPALKKKPAGHLYPDDLAGVIRSGWPAALAPLPAAPHWEHILSVGYQASMLREEERPVRLRLVLAPPETFAARKYPPMGLHRQVFSQPRPCTASELRKLSPAADFSRTLMGIDLNKQQEWEIWGLLHSGDRWLQTYHGGRQAPPVLPDVPVIHLAGPGHLAVLCGMQELATLMGGRILTPDHNVFESQWLREFFAPLRAEMLAFLNAWFQDRHNWPDNVDPNLLGIIGRHITMRIISTMRQAHQGGTFLYLPHQRRREFTSPNPLITIKYQFQKRDDLPRLVHLMQQVLLRLLEAYEQDIQKGKKLGWRDYINCDSVQLARLDEAIFEVAHQMADFASVDGAVVLTNRVQVLGFGGMIKGDFDQVDTVARAVDREGDQWRREPTESVGIRHRSVYYLCHQVPDALGIVISQDGTTRFIKQQAGLVTYWEQAVPIPLKVL
jgi:hypothetical protein